MKHSLIVILGALLSSSAFGYEADYFTRRTGYPDSAYLLNQKMNESLYVIGANSRSCNETELHRSLIRALGGLIVAPVETWASQVPGNFTPKLSESIYAGMGFQAPFMALGCCATIMRVGDTLISGDKLGHFLQSGYELYYVVRGKSSQPIADVRNLWTKFVSYAWESPMAGPQIEAVMSKLGVREGTLSDQELALWAPAMAGAVSDVQESGSWGVGSTAVKSYADMAANYGGYLFWSDLTRGSNPYFTCRVGKWHLSREFDWRLYVNDAWDEAVNCSEHSTPRMKQVISSRIAGFAAQNGWPSQTCPIVPDKCRQLPALFGEAARWILHPNCLN
jgi:hypothetical protein